MGTSSLIRNCFEESFEFFNIQKIVGSNTTTQVNPEGLYRLDRFCHIGAVQTAGEENRNWDAITNLSAQVPIVCAASSSKLFD